MRVHCGETLEDGDITEEENIMKEGEEGIVDVVYCSECYIGHLNEEYLPS